MPTGNNSEPSQSRSLIAVMGGVARATWRQVPLAAPEIDPQLENLSAVERIAEVLRYKLLHLEFAISGGGGIRAWLRLNLLIAAVLAIPAVVVVPIVTWLLGSFVTLTGFLLAAAQNLLYTLIYVVAFVSLLLAFLFSLKLVWKAHLENSRRSQKRKAS